MLKIKEYVRPADLAEAYALNQKRSARVIGGMMWLKMSRTSIGCAIDLSGLGLDYIEETETQFLIGAMTSLRSVEVHEGLNRFADGAFSDCLSPIVGVQFRNTASVGGTVFGRYGFSDLITLLLALDAKAELYKGGIMPIAEFISMKRNRDILVRIIIEKKPVRAAYLSRRNTKTDFPVLTCAVVNDGGEVKCAVGARPGIAKLIPLEQADTLAAYSGEELRGVCEKAADMLKFGSNIRAGADYRRHMAAVLLRRGCEKIMDKEAAE